MKGFTLEAFRRMAIAPVGVTVDLDIVVRAYRLRIPCAELPAVEPARSYRHSRFPIWKTGKRLGCFLVREVLRKPPTSLTLPARREVSLARPAGLEETAKPVPSAESAG